jgi:drug/metabolite transporter (DMT)-like permease
MKMIPLNFNESQIEDDKNDTLLGLIYGFGAATCYGLLFCSAKILFLWSTITVFEILYMRAFLSLLIILPILYISGINPFDVQRKHAPYLFIRCFAGFLGFAI